MSQSAIQQVWPAETIELSAEQKALAALRAEIDSIDDQILELFERLQRQYGFACLFISHDLSAVERIAHRVAVMNQGEVVEIGSRDSIFDTPQHPYTRRLLAAASPLEKGADGSYRLRASVI